MSAFPSVAARHPRQSRRLTLHTVRSGDRLIVETIDPDEAQRRVRAWNKVTADVFPPATITTTEFVAAEGGAA